MRNPRQKVCVCVDGKQEKWITELSRNHCDHLPAYFGQGTKLTVLGKYFYFVALFTTINKKKSGQSLFNRLVQWNIKKTLVKWQLWQFLMLIKKFSWKNEKLYWVEITVNDGRPVYFGQGTKLTVLGKYFHFVSL